MQRRRKTLKVRFVLTSFLALAFGLFDLHLLSIALMLIFQLCKLNQLGQRRQLIPEG